MILAAATATATEPDAGWGNLLGLLTAIGLFWLGTAIHKRWGKPLPPAQEGFALEGVKPQISAGSDPAVTPSGKGSPEGEPDLDGFVQSKVGAARPSQIIRDARRRFRVSDSTVKRAIRRAKGTAS